MLAKLDNQDFSGGKRGRQGIAYTQAALDGVAEAERRLRALEERFSNLERRSQVTEENMLSSDRKIKAEIKLLASEVSGFKAQITGQEEKLKALANELQGFARSEDVDVIRKYLNLIEPLGFVTQAEVERVVRQVVDAALEEQEAAK